MAYLEQIKKQICVRCWHRFIIFILYHFGTSLFLSIIVSIKLIGCGKKDHKSSASKPQKENVQNEHPEHPSKEHVKSEHPEHPSKENEKSEHPEHPSDD